MGLYDQYKLQNSTTVPMFTGTTAPEALEVGKHMQALYDIARTGAGEIDSASEMIQSLDKDKVLRDEVMGKIKGNIDTWSKEKDWENKVEDVRSLGRWYANRSNELAAPLKQAQKYQEELDTKEKNLTPLQKQVLTARSMAGYKGLQKDPSGRLVGTFQGVDPAENINMVEWAEKVGKDIAPFKGATKIDHVSGTGYIVTKGNKTEIVSEERVQNALRAAMNMDTKMQAFLSMEGENAAFTGSRIPVAQMPDTLPDGTPNIYKQQAIASAQKFGTTPEQEFGKMMGDAAKNNIANSASQYLRNKYAYKNTEYEYGLKGDNVWEFNQKQAQANENGLFGDAVTGTGIDLTKRFGSASDIETSMTTNKDAIEKASNEVGAAKNVIASALGTTMDKLTPQQISDYYTKNDPAGLGKFQANQRLVESSKQSVAELNQLRDAAMDLAVKKKNPGQTFATLRTNATKDLAQVFTKNPKLNLVLDGKKLTAADLNNSDPKQGYEVIDGDNGYADDSNYINIRNKETGVIHKVRTVNSIKQGKERIDTYEGPILADEDVRKIGARFDNLDWKAQWKEAATNIRSNSAWMPLLNKTTPDGQTTKAGAYASRVNGILRAGASALNIKDGNLTNLDSDDTKDMRARISAGQFDVIGVGKVGSDGKLYTQLSVEVDKTADDPAKRFKTVVVGVDSNMANKLSAYAQEAGYRDKDMRTVQIGLAMAPGSGYEQALDMGTTGRLQVNDVVVKDKSGKEIGGGKPLYEVVPNITGQNSDSLTYELYKLDDKGDRAEHVETFTDALDLGMFLDTNRQSGRTVKKKTK